MENSPQESTSEFPMRINKYVALKGYATRRDADTLVSMGKVFINKKKAVLGDKVNESDLVEVKIQNKRTYTYLAYNKPKGMLTNSEEGVAGITESLPPALQKLNLFPIGRLDKASHGLIILTNDGRVTDRLLNPKYEHTKVYEVRTKKPLRASFKEKLVDGIEIEGYKTKPAQVKKTGESSFRITLTEGKTHQVRRMVVALFNEVDDLRRTDIMNIKIAKLPRGEYRPIEGVELKTFLESLGLSI